MRIEEPGSADPLRLGTLLRQSHRKAAQALDAALEPLGISARHFGVILHLARLGEATQKQLLELTGADKAGMARTVEALVAAGCVERRADEADRRINRLTLTPRGAALAADARARAQVVGERLFADLSEPERGILAGLLTRVVTAPAPEPGE